MLTQDTSINKISELYEKRNVFLFEIVSQIPAEEKTYLIMNGKYYFIKLSNIVIFLNRIIH